jgi:hypothetical protein
MIWRRQTGSRNRCLPGRSSNGRGWTPQGLPLATVAGYCFRHGVGPGIDCSELSRDHPLELGLNVDRGELNRDQPLQLGVEGEPLRLERRNRVDGHRAP